MAKVPTKPGFYWAQWRIIEAGTTDEDQLGPEFHWGVVDVFVNCMDETDPEHLRVHVPGVERSQSIENFVWGNQVAPFEPRAALAAAGGRGNT